MQIYLLATNLFALAALLLGLGSFARGVRTDRLLPLFLLVISRSLGLILVLAIPEQSHEAANMAIEALEVFSTFCVVWVLIYPTSQLPAPWPVLAWGGAGGALLLSVLPLLPLWPIPSEIHSLAIAIFSTPLILVSLGQVRWTHLVPPLMFSLANFISLLGFTSVSWLVNLLAYAFLINGLHWQSIQTYFRTYQDRQAATEALVQDTININREQQRWLEVSEMISSLPNLNQSAEHIARSMAHITQADQSAIFVLDGKAREQAHLVTLYSPERPVHIAEDDRVSFILADCPPLQAAIETQQQVLYPPPNSSAHNVNGLRKLYDLWQENRLGPTLIQPLTVRGQPVGALMVGNPVTNRPIRPGDVRLCRAVASQIAALVEYRRRYLELETQAEAIAVTVQQQSKMVKAATRVESDATIEVYLPIMESISDGVVVSDATGRVRLVNKAAERILGKPGPRLIGQPIATIYGEIEAKEPIEELMVAFSRRNQPLPTFIETEERAIQGRLIPWRNEDREWLGIIAVFRDVTREVKADRARNDFIAALSHELRAPLTTVKGYSELITFGAMGDYSPQQVHLQQLIHSSAERMVEVLDNAIQVSAENRHKVLPRFEEIDVVKVIDEAIREITPLARTRELRLTREIKTELPLISVDRRHLRKILESLLSNACRFTPPGGFVTLRAWMQAERGEGNVSRPQLLLAVSDNGIGIAKEETKRIFDPFYQVKNQSLEEESGMGMGLAVVKELVELNNGRVWVESVVSEGSVFQVALPLAQEY